MLQKQAIDLEDVKAKRKAYNKAWRLANPGYEKQWVAKNPDKKHAKRIKWLYGITLEDYNTMFVNQKGCCAICSKHRNEQKRNLSVDHCHKTNTVRQLLCDLCNRAIGYMKEDVNLLESAIEYLRRHHGSS